MALATTVNFVFRDQKGKTSTTKIRVPSTFSFAQYAEFAESAAQILASASQAQLVETSVSVALDLTGLGLKTTIALFADIYQKALFTVRTAVSGLFSKFNFPTLDDGMVLPNSDVLDTTEAAVAAMQTIIEDGVADGTTISVVDSRGNDLVEVSQMREIFRKS